MKIKSLIKLMDNTEEVIIVDRGIKNNYSIFELSINIELIERKIINLLIINNKIHLYIK